MRIAIDFTATPKNKTGIGRYMLGLVRGLQEIDGADEVKAAASEGLRDSDELLENNEYFLYIQDDDLDGFDISAANFHIIPVRSRIMRKQYMRILWEQIVFPWRIRRIGADILHCPNYTMPYLLKLISRRTGVVGVFHDMSYFIYPEYLVGWKARLFRGYIRHTARRADKLLTISESSRVDIPRFSNPRNKDISVTYMGVNESFFDSVPADEALLSEYGITKKYIIYVGTLEPRKNVPNLIRAFRKMNNDEYELVIVGKKGWGYDEIYETVHADEKLQNKVIFTGFVEDAKMQRLMRSASAVAYISRYEGFGIPVIEGMASSVPTVTTSVSSLKEVAGDCCFLCDPDDIDSISRALVTAVTNTDRSKIDKALARARSFSWSNCARETLKAYESISEAACKSCGE